MGGNVEKNVVKAETLETPSEFEHEFYTSMQFRTELLK